MSSLFEALDTLRPRLPARWASASALRRVRAAAARLPAGSPVCFLERRFREARGRVDFGACYPNPSHRALLRGSELLARQTPFIWLEVDHSRIDDRSRPCVLLCVDPALGRRAFGQIVPPLSDETLLTFAAAAHRLFLNVAPPQALQNNLLTCFRALPPKGRILHVSFMPSRNPAVTKLNVVLPKSSLFGYLEQIGWPGSRAALEAVWRNVGPAVSRAKIDVTLGHGVNPKLGLEVHPFNASVDGRKRVLVWLEREGLADSTQTADLSAWHGRREALCGGKRMPIVLDFGMKVVLDAQSQLDAKAYLQVATESRIAPAPSARPQRKSDVRS